MQEVEGCWPSSVGLRGQVLNRPGAALAEDRRGLASSELWRVHQAVDIGHGLVAPARRWMPSPPVCFQLAS